MTKEEKLLILSSMVDGTDNEDVLSTYLLIAGKKIIAKAFPFDTSIEEVPSQYELLQCEIAAYLLNKRGAEGQTQHTENGISRSYENADIPKSMLRQITPECGTLK